MLSPAVEYMHHRLSMSSTLSASKQSKEESDSLHPAESRDNFANAVRVQTSNHPVEPPQGPLFKLVKEIHESMSAE